VVGAACVEASPCAVRCAPPGSDGALLGVLVTVGSIFTMASCLWFDYCNGNRPRNFSVNREKPANNPFNSMLKAFLRGYSGISTVPRSLTTPLTTWPDGVRTLIDSPVAALFSALPS